MPRRKGRNKRPEQERPLPVLEVEVEDDLAGLSAEEIAEEKQMFQDRADRVRYGLVLNPARTPPQPQPKPNSKS